MMSRKKRFGLTVFAIVLVVGFALGVVSIGMQWSAWQWQGKVVDITVPHPPGAYVVSHVRVESRGFVRDIDTKQNAVNPFDLDHPEREIFVETYPSFWKFVFGGKGERWNVHLYNSYHRSRGSFQLIVFCNVERDKCVDHLSVPSEIVEIYRKARGIPLLRELPPLTSS